MEDYKTTLNEATSLLLRKAELIKNLPTSREELLTLVRTEAVFVWKVEKQLLKDAIKQNRPLILLAQQTRSDFNDLAHSLELEISALKQQDDQAYLLVVKQTRVIEDRIQKKAESIAKTLTSRERSFIKQTMLRMSGLLAVLVLATACQSTQPVPVIPAQVVQTHKVVHLRAGEFVVPIEVNQAYNDVYENSAVGYYVPHSSLFNKLIIKLSTGKTKFENKLRELGYEEQYVEYYSNMFHTPGNIMISDGRPEMFIETLQHERIHKAWDDLPASDSTHLLEAAKKMTAYLAQHPEVCEGRSNPPNCGYAQNTVMKEVFEFYSWLPQLPVQVEELLARSDPRAHSIYRGMLQYAQK